MTRTYHITTFGCQMNAYDSDVMEGIMTAKGWTRADREEEADVILYNTCVVRDHAEQRALARLDQLARLKRERPDRIIGVTGCMAQKEAEALHERLPHVDLVLGTRAIARLSPLLDRVIATGTPQACTEILDDGYPADVVPVRQRPLKALVNIIFGCNKNCSYCIVPRTRGREVSRPWRDIVEEARRLRAHQYREITLVGQNVNSYRQPGEGTRSFGNLLRRVGEAAGGTDSDAALIRYITSHPRDCNAAHIRAVAETPNVCENFHLPVQAGANRVLRRMRRSYTRERYLELIDEVRAAVPDATLTTDIIVGFPGETPDEFDQTLDLVRRVRFDSAYMYMYSTRPGTPAAEEFKDHIPLAEKKARLAALIALQEQISLELNRAAIGRRFAVLIEDVAPRTPGDLLARTRGDKMVILPGPREWVGRFAEVEVHDANGHTLFARPVAVARAAA
ncbi:MAG TPA: tRNA (N6-isopentenyl adenosine(37)-C2)-methylthiotransferase MiaB [Candidatus Sumerlaeota bacterium]|nr:tRNA (N6-isopentenyl adenosine(37)-C2)-methylthiotransferase MiaB [Candidatus Sumerlaeota bacterium]